MDNDDIKFNSNYSNEPSSKALLNVSSRPQLRRLNTSKDYLSKSFKEQSSSDDNQPPLTAPLNDISKPSKDSKRNLTLNLPKIQTKSNSNNSSKSNGRRRPSPLISTFTSSSSSNNFSNSYLEPPKTSYLSSTSFEDQQLDYHSTSLPQSPLLSSSFSDESEQVKSFDPSIIIPNSIIIGPEPQSIDDLKILKSMGVKQILNTALECNDNLNLKDIFDRYDKIPMVDNAHACDVQEAFASGSDFIDDARLHSRPIYVHCKAGKSRSIAIVTAHLIRANRWNINRAYDYVKARREVASPNIGFVAELMMFQKELNITFTDNQGEDNVQTQCSSPYLNDSKQDNKLKSSFDLLTGCRTPSNRPMSAGPGVYITRSNSNKNQTSNNNINDNKRNANKHTLNNNDNDNDITGSSNVKVDDFNEEIKNKLHLQETLGNHSEVEKKDKNGRYIHPRRAPVDNRLQPLRRVSKAGLESSFTLVSQLDNQKP